MPDATVNDVVLSIVGGALRTYLDARGELPREMLTAMAPISVRGSGEKAALGNLVSAMVIGLGPPSPTRSSDCARCIRRRSIPRR